MCSVFASFCVTFMWSASWTFIMYGHWCTHTHHAHCTHGCVVLNCGTADIVGDGNDKHIYWRLRFVHYIRRGIRCTSRGISILLQYNIQFAAVLLNHCNTLFFFFFIFRTLRHSIEKKKKKVMIRQKPYTIPVQIKMDIDVFDIRLEKYWTDIYVEINAHIIGTSTCNFTLGNMCIICICIICTIICYIYI